MTDKEHEESTWVQPSHPNLIEVRYGADPSSFTTSSHSLVDLPAGAHFTRLTFPPLSIAAEPQYSTLQISRTLHVFLNSDLAYVNHSCAPSLEFDVDAMEIRISRDRALHVGDELTFFYPSTEWVMAQGFNCRCGTDCCKGWIGGAKDMGRATMKGLWLNRFIEEMYVEAENEEARANRT